jgi:hypothetical protein
MKNPLFDIYRDVQPGSAESAAAYFIRVYRERNGEVGDELHASLVTLAGMESGRYLELVAKFLEDFID